TSFKMVKFAISAFVVAQLCLLQAQASHYIQYRLNRVDIVHYGAICIHNGDQILMADGDKFASSVQNYGFHQNGFSANVNWKNQNVGVQGWGTYWFDTKSGEEYQYVTWEGCWETSDSKCAHFRTYAKAACDEALRKIMVSIS
ncbi:hypothetical protein BGX33_008917, partial [Mortierella sp. NVP41]